MINKKITMMCLIIDALRKEFNNTKSKILVSKLGFEKRYSEQILQTMVRHGILHSTKGHRGGYVLTSKGRSISAIDLIMESHPDYRTFDIAFGDAVRNVMPDAIAKAHRQAQRETSENAA